MNGSGPIRIGSSSIGSCPSDVPKPLSFGTGSHFCLGSHMARMTLEEVTLGLANHSVSLGDDPGNIEWRQVLGRSPVAIEVVSA